MAKFTKANAKEVCDNYRWTMSYLNGGTSEENERQAPACYESLQVHVKAAAEIVANPNKRLSEDAWLMENLRELPERLEKFRVRYGL